MAITRGYKDSEILDELVTRILCDTQPPRGRADAVYLFGETKDNEASVIAAGEFLYRLGRVHYVLINNLKDLRNKINYKGYLPSIEEINDSLSLANSLFDPMIGEILKEIGKLN